jgi:hypothetical protein
MSIHLCGGVTREICREAMYAEGERDFTAMMHIVLHHMTDDPSTRQGDLFAIFLIGERLLHIGGAPASQSIRNHLPGKVETLSQFGCCLDRCSLSESGPVLL